MKLFSIILIIILLSLIRQTTVIAQTDAPQKIKISSGKGVNGDYNRDIYFSDELEYNLKDSLFRYRWKPKKPFMDLKTKPTEIFRNPNTYKSLDSLYNNFTEYKFKPGGKPMIYRIELIYYTDKSGLPAKIKTMDFMITNENERDHQTFIDKLLGEYRGVLRKNAL